MTSRCRFAVPAAVLVAMALSPGCGSSPTPAAPTSAVTLSSGIVAATAAGDAAIEITIRVAPNVLNLQNQGEVVTVHTDLPYSSVAGTSVTLNGVAIDWWKADNQGQFVAKFVMSAIKSLPLKVGEYNTLRIEGTRTDATAFWGSASVLVIDKSGT